MPNDDRENFEVVKDFATAVSTQARISNRFWLILMTVTLAKILPAAGSELHIPLIGVSVDPKTYYESLLWMLIIFTLAFCVASSQQINAQQIAQAYCKANNAKVIHGLSPQLWYDIIREPSLNRISSLPQAIRGDEAYSWELNWTLLRALAGVASYGILKVISLGIYYGLPGWALFQAYRDISLQLSPLHRWLALRLDVVAETALLVVFVMDLAIAVLKIVPHIWSQKSA